MSGRPSIRSRGERRRASLARGPIYHYHSSILRQRARTRRANPRSERFVRRSSERREQATRHPLKRRLVNTSAASDCKIAAYANDEISLEGSPEIKGRKIQVANGPLDGSDVRYWTAISSRERMTRAFVRREKARVYTLFGPAAYQ